jgi:hypothetical protein
MKFDRYIKLIFESLQSKTAVFSYGRYNPPTIGHQLLIDTLKKEAEKVHGDAFLIPSHTQDSKKNPLSLHEKVNLLKKMAPGVEVLDSGKTLVDALKDLQSRGYTDVIQIAGSDRIPEYQIIRDKYNGKPAKDGNVPFEFRTYEIVSSGERDPDSEGVEGMSASKVRNFALNGDYKSFDHGLSQALNEQEKRSVYNAIRERIKK